MNQRDLQRAVELAGHVGHMLLAMVSPTGRPNNLTAGYVCMCEPKAGAGRGHDEQRCNVV